MCEIAWLIRNVSLLIMLVVIVMIVGCVCPDDSFFLLSFSLFRFSFSFLSLFFLFPNTHRPTHRCLCIPTEPKLEVMEGGCLICCMKCTCCTTDQVVVMPYEKCCCCSNRVGCCDNACGCCGSLTGNPKSVTSFEPQPKDCKAFVAAAQQVMSRN